MNPVIIYTDGACSGNPGPGGWAAILRHNGAEKVISGGTEATTNNRMELMAAIAGLEALKKPCDVHICTDSAYLANAFNQEWIARWKKNGWKTSSRKPVENQDLWRRLLVQTERHNVTFIKVKGHANDETNNLVDEMAVAAMKPFMI